MIIRKVFLIIFTFFVILPFSGCGSTASSGSYNHLDEIKHIRISVAGSSITSGDNTLIGEDSYVGQVEKYLREELATTLMPSQLHSNTLPDIYEDESMCYRGILAKYKGTGTTISGELDGDELSLAYAKERGNLGASVIELYIDDVLYDTFSTYDERVAVKMYSLTFESDHKKRYFDLGHAFTYDHKVYVNGRRQKGHINYEFNGKRGKDQNDGITPSFDGDDYMIIRKLSEKGEVHHFLLFRKPPRSGEVKISFWAGESIKPGKSTVANLKMQIGSGLESPFGEGSRAYDAAKKENIASGLDFRQTDERAVKTWIFNKKKKRNFTFKISALDRRAEGSEAEFFINFVTNRMHYVQNAGIGGFTASDFLQKGTLTSIEQIIAFQPNVFILESGTNDANYLDNIPTTNQWLARDKRDFRLEPHKVVFNDFDPDNKPQRGDILVFGEYQDRIDNVAVRVIEKWSDAEKTAYFDKAIENVGFYQSLCQVKRIAQWEENVENIINKVQNGVSYPILLAIATGGVPNLQERHMAGYHEKGIMFAKRLDIKYIDFYKKTYAFNGGLKERGLPVEERWSYGDNTHPNPNGRYLFAETVIETLQ